MTSISDFLTACSFVSSAKMVANFLTTSGKSFIWIKNNTGTKILGRIPLATSAY